RAGQRIAVCPEIQVTHLKRWTLGGMMRSDVWDRGMPWTELALREKNLPKVLNLEGSQRLAGACTAGFAALGALAACRGPRLRTLRAALLLGLLLLDARSEKPPGAGRLGLALFATASLAALVATLMRLGSLAVAAAVLLLVVLWLNRRFYAFLAAV